jgi:hypothetical protein
MNILIIYERDMAVDCAAAAFFRMINSKVFVLSAHSRATPLTAADLPNTPPGGWNQIVVIGTYWSRGETAFDFTTLCPEVQFYSFGDVIAAENVTYANQDDCFGPFRFAIDCARPHCGSAIISLFTNARAELIELIDQRALGHNVIGTQPFFTGFFNYFAKNDHVTNFTHLFTGEVDFDEVQEMGKTIYESQIQMASERAKNNSKVVTLRNGKTALVTEAPELCNLSHQALREIDSHPVTITVKMALNTDKLHYSVRTYDGTDAREIVNAIDGGGSDFAAGGCVDFELKVPL